MELVSEKEQLTSLIPIFSNIYTSTISSDNGSHPSTKKLQKLEVRVRYPLNEYSSTRKRQIDNEEERPSTLLLDEPPKGGKKDYTDFVNYSSRLLHQERHEKKPIHAIIIHPTTFFAH